MPRARITALVALCVLLAGCSGLGGTPGTQPDTPTTSPTPDTTTGTRSPTTTTHVTTEGDPTFKLRVENELNHAVEYRLVLRYVSNGTVFHNQTHAVGANNNVILDSAVGDRDQFEFTVRVSENASVSKSVFAGQGYQVTIRGDHNVTVRKLAGSS